MSISIDPLTGIRILDATLDYSDTSEDRVLTELERATDRSSESDELADAMVDWPTRYHFSRMRGHLIQPLVLKAGIEVLDVGCGTGAITRAFGERGAQVLGIEGALPRARAAALRCADLENVEIVCGDISHLETNKTFDLVCLVGVLEYAATSIGGKHGPESLLKHLRKLVKPGGALLVAIENQIGLKYLLGYREDHVALPWAGLEDYAEGFGARTWSRRQLGNLLDTAGFDEQRWLFPFPDYKLPSVILSEGAYQLDNSSELVDQVVRLPVQDYAFPRTILTDDRRVHNVFLNAGLGPDVANSFLVLASSDNHTLDELVDPMSLAWIVGGERRAQWKRTQVVVSRNNGLRVTARPNSGDQENRKDRWLTQVPVRDDPWHRGPTLEQIAIESCHTRDEQGLATALKQWTLCLTKAQVQASEHATSHPYSPSPGAPALPDDMLDVSLSNFVLSDEGIVFVDREWHVEGGVDPGLAGLRALWFFALDLVNGGARHPWPDTLTVDDMSREMAALCGFPAQLDDLNRMYRAEAELQSLVIGFNQERVTRDLRNSGQNTLKNPNAACPTRWTHLHEFP
ncbi:MAG: hypothetical protein DRJ65_22240 [Acidobacteria bacterium]|nr:MAG: hypothetical protein DRJ65_22240 [Acidobacteriota bacterium]